MKPTATYRHHFLPAGHRDVEETPLGPVSGSLWCWFCRSLTMWLWPHHLTLLSLSFLMREKQHRPERAAMGSREGRNSLSFLTNTNYTLTLGDTELLSSHDATMQPLLGAQPRLCKTVHSSSQSLSADNFCSWVPLLPLWPLLNPAFPLCQSVPDWCPLGFVLGPFFFICLLIPISWGGTPSALPVLMTPQLIAFALASLLSIPSLCGHSHMPFVLSFY